MRNGSTACSCFPLFKENVVVACKIGSFQKNVIVFFFGNQISKWRSFEKRAIFDLLFTFFSYQGKVTKIPSAHISLTNIHVFCSPYWLFQLAYQFWKKKCKFIRYGFSLVWFLVLILICTILEQSINNNMVSKFELECLLLIFYFLFVLLFYFYSYFFFTLMPNL